MKKSVATAMAAPNALTARGLAGYSPIIAVGNGMKDWHIRKREFNHTIP